MFSRSVLIVGEHPSENLQAGVMVKISELRKSTPL